ncbi:MAG: hypothetical protein QM699_06840 [Amaricoccus sp.]|uniref:hypothetical protein n=1 Tax=Amaricoccus sp. TaxID=1872485 RepID=UPI0039E6B804
MNKEGLYALWLRWMHRRDVEADLDTVFEQAKSKITQRLMRPVPDLSTDDALNACINSMPRSWQHAGLVYLHELAQDDEGLMREQEMFEAAAAAEHFRWSLDNTTPDMLAR